MDTTETRKAAAVAIAWREVRGLLQGKRWQLPQGAGWIIAEGTKLRHRTIRWMVADANQLDVLAAAPGSPGADDWLALCKWGRRAGWTARRWHYMHSLSAIEPYAEPRAPLSAELAELQARIERDMEHDQTKTTDTCRHRSAGA